MTADAPPSQAVSNSAADCMFFPAAARCFRIQDMVVVGIWNFMMNLLV